MSWNDFHQRQHAIATVLDTARQNPSQALDQVPAPFSDATELLRALQYKWTQQLTGRIDVALAETGDAADGDRIQAVTEAWRRTAAANPALRDLLDQHQANPVLRADSAREHRMLALASGLAEPGEPDAEVVRVGQAFLQLVRATPTEQRKSCLLSLR
ncbi:hypothetical protein ABT337_08380 [Saccharopolyspora hirsuta]|uniref:Uncharacterized protein n=1 Tax=Saccharopolyspora hirsuta TaxID=1837 RepID=A0A5M7BDB6_SACHI|nr:hypothetical protein [Saccharopolyspora hirsuta]KAA5826730.1 hypothetical protein F1721_29930 [Saccharopolyspora hirsuta]